MKGKPMNVLENLTDRSRKLFLDLAEDASNWGGNPPLNGNVRTDVHLRGNITDLKKVGLIETFRDDGITWVNFTELGESVVNSLGINLY